jgi:hypothetical protein
VFDQLEALLLDELGEVAASTWSGSASCAGVASAPASPGA